MSPAGVVRRELLPLEVTLFEIGYYQINGRAKYIKVSPEGYSDTVNKSRKIRHV